MTFTVNADLEVNGKINQYGDSLGGGGVENSAGENVIPKSDGTNLVPSILSESVEALVAAGSLLPEAAGTRTLGATTRPFASVYIGGASLQRTLLQSSATTTRTVTIPNATGSLALSNPSVHALPKLLAAGIFGDSRISDDGTNIIITGLPTSNPGVLGALWNDGGILKISTG